MKYKFLFVLIIISFSEIDSQDLLSFTPKSAKILPTDEITKLENDIEKLDVLLQNTTDLRIVSELNKAKAELNNKIMLLRISGTVMESELGGELMTAIEKKASAPSLKIASDIQLRPTGGGDQGDFLSPIVAANYKNRFLKFDGSTFTGQYDFLLSIQSPSSTSDTNKMITRILSTGPDGLFQVGTKFGWVGIENAFLIGFNGKLNWLNSRSIDNENLASFAFLSYSHLIITKLGPVIFGYEQEFRFVSSDSKDILSNSIDKAMSGNLLIGINLGQILLQLKYLLNSNKVIESNERLEIRFGAALDILN